MVSISSQIYIVSTCAIDITWYRMLVAAVVAFTPFGFATAMTYREVKNIKLIEDVTKSYFQSMYVDIDRYTYRVMSMMIILSEVSYKTDIDASIVCFTIFRKFDETSLLYIYIIWNSR